MLEIGQVLRDRYQLKEKLGQNAGRQTWLAQDLAVTPQQTVVVKLLAFGGEVQWDHLRLFEREAQVLKQLNHSQIPKYRDYFSLDQHILWFGLVQEHIPGVSLKQFIAQGQRLTESKIKQVVKDILQILIYLHNLHPRVLHRDIKPSNLILADDGKIYLIDFGAVQDKAAQEGATFTVVGTYGYAPLEQFGGKAVPASDLYALGATIVHLLSGIAPGDLPQKDLRMEFSDCLSLQNIDSSLIDWLEKCTQPALEKRFPSAQEALEALENPKRTKSSSSRGEGQLAPTPGKVTPPRYTSIQIDNHSEKLQITIPPKFNITTVVPIPFIVFSLVVLIHLFLPLVIIILILIISNLHRLGEQKLILKQGSFVIYKTLLGFKLKQQHGLINAIQDVSIYYQRADNQNEMTPQGINITSSTPFPEIFQRNLFGKGLTEVELMWLVQEIRDWLTHQS